MRERKKSIVFASVAYERMYNHVFLSNFCVQAPLPPDGRACVERMEVATLITRTDGRPIAHASSMVLTTHTVREPKRGGSSIQSCVHAAEQNLFVNSILTAERLLLMIWREYAAGKIGLRANPRLAPVISSPRR